MSLLLTRKNLDITNKHLQNPPLAYLHFYAFDDHKTRPSPSHAPPFPFVYQQEAYSCAIVVPIRDTVNFVFKSFSSEAKDKY